MSKSKYENRTNKSFHFITKYFLIFPLLYFSETKTGHFIVPTSRGISEAVLFTFSYWQRPWQKFLWDHPYFLDWVNSQNILGKTQRDSTHFLPVSCKFWNVSIDYYAFLIFIQSLGYDLFLILFYCNYCDPQSPS